MPQEELRVEVRWHELFYCVTFQLAYQVARQGVSELYLWRLSSLVCYVNVYVHIWADLSDDHGVKWLVVVVVAVHVDVIFSTLVLVCVRPVPDFIDVVVLDVDREWFVVYDLEWASGVDRFLRVQAVFEETPFGGMDVVAYPFYPDSSVHVVGHEDVLVHGKEWSAARGFCSSVETVSGRVALPDSGNGCRLRSRSGEDTVLGLCLTFHRVRKWLMLICLELNWLLRVGH